MKWILPVCGAALVLLFAAGPDPAEEQLQKHRNLGKAFYENPTTQTQAVEEFRKALELRPKSAPERLNYGLALLRAGKTKEGISELEQVQKQDPKLPHTWFNLGIEFKKLGEYDGATRQFERMVQLVPDEPISHYNLGVLYKLGGKVPEAIMEFETAARLDANFAAPRFQLYNAYRQAGRREDAARQLQAFQALKKQQEGAAIPEDVDWSFYSEVYDYIDPKLSADDQTAPLPLRFQARKLAGAPLNSRMVVTDADGDGKPDLLVWSEAGVRLYRSGSVAVQNSGLSGLKGVIAIAPGDFNNDGLQDLCVITNDGPVFYLNAKGTYKRHAAALPAQRFESAVWLDYDRDYDLDLFLLGSESMLFRNEGSAGFANRTADFPFVKGYALEGVGFRVVADSKSIDLAVSYRDRAGVLYRDQLGGKYTTADLALPAGAHSLQPYDLNNDSWIDLASSAGLLLNREGRFEPAKVPWSNRFAIADLDNRAISDVVSNGNAYRNLGLGNFEHGKNATGLIPGTEWVAADFNADGKLDLITIAADGSITLLTNATATPHQWMKVSLAGIKNAKLAPYSEVEVKAGTRYQKKVYEGVPLHFGLRAYRTAESVRITWPNGLIQNEMKQMAGLPTKVYKEAQRLSGSCPIIWTWNGREFEYITDVLGVAPLGASSGDGQYFAVDHDEYVQIRGESLRPVDGKLEIRITEELSEVAYLDQVQLIAVDHPSETEIFTNDKFKSPPFPEFRLFGVKQRVYPKTARDHRGRDVLRKIIARDKQYPDDFSRTVSGVAREHNLDLDFGKGAEGVLVLSGWVDWADGSTFLGMSQEGGLIPPYLQVKDAAGQWKTVIEDMGMPAGKPKSIVVDLTGKWLSASREVRIVTNLCVYWDEIFLSPDAAMPEARLTALDPATALLRFRGFSEARIHPERKQPEIFFYARWSPTSMWNPTPGLYTRFGDVRELLTQVDDRFVIMGSGDEVRLHFDAAALPPLKPGHRRDYLLMVDGWAKDRDPNTAHSQTVEPLPFHGMTQYPYLENERYPESPAHLRYRKEYNTRPALRLIRPLAASRGTAE